MNEDDWLYIAKQTDGYSGSDLSTLVNDGLMRPIKEIQQASFFKKVPKQELIDKKLVSIHEFEVSSEEESTQRIDPA